MIVRRTLCTDPPFREYTIIYEFASSGRTIAYYARAPGNYSPTIAHASPVLAVHRGAIRHAWGRMPRATPPPCPSRSATRCPLADRTGPAPGGVRIGRAFHARRVFVKQLGLPARLPEPSEDPQMRQDDQGHEEGRKERQRKAGQRSELVGVREEEPARGRDDEQDVE